MKRSLLALTLLVLGGFSPVEGQKRPRFEGSTTVVAVEIPVNVVRKGEPVRNLTADQFRVMDGGVERPIVDFEVVDLAVTSIDPSRTEGAGSVPLPARRHFLLLFDLSYTARPNLLRSIRSAHELLDGRLHATDRVAMGVFGALEGARLLMGFTPNHAEIGRALDALEALVSGTRPEMATAGDTARVRRDDPLRLVGMGGSVVAAEVGGNAGDEWLTGIFDDFDDTGGRGAGIVTETIADMIDVTRVEIVSRKQSEVINYTEALGQLAAATADIEGRKYLVLFSQGFGMPDGDVYAGDNIRMINAMDQVAAIFRRAGWVMVGVNVSGLNESRAGSDTMFNMAKETGGELYERFNDLGAAMGRMLAKNSVTYLLTVQAEDVPLDGSFRRLKVSLRDKPRGVRISHREGYSAPGAAPPPESGWARALSLGQRVLSGDEGGVLAPDVLAVTVDRMCERRAVAVWITVDGSLFADRQTGETFEGEVFTYALDAQGEIQDFFTQVVRLDRERVATTLATGALQVYGTLALPPGPHSLRVLVRTAEGREGLRDHPLQIPTEVPAVALSPPLFPADPRSPLVVVRVEKSGLTSDAAAARYPFRMGGKTFVPEVRPVLRAEQPRRVVVIANGLDLEQHAVRARVVRDGVAVDHARLNLIGRDKQGATADDELYFRLDAAGLGSGRYELEVAIDHPSTDQTVAVGAYPFFVSGQ